MSRIIDMTGKSCGKLTVLRRDGNSAKGQAKWLCQCECGNTSSVEGVKLRNGNTRSCGCAMRIRHGMNGTPTYNSWVAMKSRCKGGTEISDTYYASRGISVCKRWQNFKNFFADMGERPEGTTLDRIDNDKGYFQGNCRWATRKEQVRNRRGVKLSASRVNTARRMHRKGVSQKALAWLFGCDPSTISDALAGKSWA